MDMLIGALIGGAVVCLIAVGLALWFFLNMAKGMNW